MSTLCFFVHFVLQAVDNINPYVIHDRSTVHSLVVFIIQWPNSYISQRIPFSVNISYLGMFRSICISVVLSVLADAIFQLRWLIKRGLWAYKIVLQSLYEVRIVAAIYGRYYWEQGRWQFICCWVAKFLDYNVDITAEENKWRRWISRYMVWKWCQQLSL